MEDGDDTESNSIGNQAKIADAFLAEYPDIQIVERYADNGYTGMNYNRPGLSSDDDGCTQRQDQLHYHQGHLTLGTSFRRDQ